MSHHRTCCVYLCQAFKQDTVVSYFGFPKDPKRCEAWVNACRNKHVEYFFKNKGSEYMHRRYKICSKHFKYSDFRNPNLTSQGLISSAVPTQKLKMKYSTKTKKFKTEVTKDDNDSNVKKPFQYTTNSTETTTDSNSIISCNINPLLIGSKTETVGIEKSIKNTGFDVPIVCKIENNQINCTEFENINTHTSLPSKKSSTTSENNTNFNLISNKPHELKKTVEILQKKLEASHNILMNTQKENITLKKQVSKVKMIIKNHETRYDCLEKRLNKFKKQISRLREEKKKLFLDKKKCVISKYVDNDLAKKKSLRYTETDKFFSLSLYLCSKYVYKSMQKHFLLPSICSINEWLQDTNLVEECKKKIPESEMLRNNVDLKNSSELIELEYINVS